MHPFPVDPTRLSREEPIRFPGPEGELEGLWRPAPPGAPSRGVAVVAHPHPAYGGTMHNKVVFHTARMLNHELRFATLRFNFRSVGESRGAYDGGRGEREDVIAAWNEARRRIAEGPAVAAGFSFGAAMSLLAALEPRAPRPDAFALLGVPLRLFPPPEPYPAAIPAAAVHGGEDEYTPAARVRALLASWPAPTAFHVVPGTDHFFAGRLPDATGFLTAALGAWIDSSGAINARRSGDP